MITGFDIAQNVVVEFLLPDINGDAFIIGLSDLGGTDVLAEAVGIFRINSSLLGGTDVLGSDSAFRWFAAEAETSNVQLSVGGSIENALYFQPAPATARITLQSWTFDPNVNKAMRANTPVRIRLEAEDLSRVLFTGYIDTLNVAYAPNEPNLIQITAYDVYKQVVNSRVTSIDTTTFGAYATPLQQFTKAVQATGATVSGKSVATTGKIPSFTDSNVTVVQYINEAIKVGLAVVWVDQDTEDIVFAPRPRTASGTSTTYIVGNDHSDSPYHLCLSDISIGLDADTVYNSIYVELQSDPLVNITRKDQTSINLWGESALDETLNVTDATELGIWVDGIFSQTPTKLVQSVTTPAIDRLGNLTNAAVFTPGTLIGVHYTQNQLVINDYYTIVSVRHEIDVDNWFTTLELWKEV